MKIATCLFLLLGSSDLTFAAPEKELEPLPASIALERLFEMPEFRVSDSFSSGVWLFQDEMIAAKSQEWAFELAKSYAEKVADSEAGDLRWNLKKSRELTSRKDYWEKEVWKENFKITGPKFSEFDEARNLKKVKEWFSQKEATNPSGPIWVFQRVSLGEYDFETETFNKTGTTYGLKQAKAYTLPSKIASAASKKVRRSVLLPEYAGYKEWLIDSVRFEHGTEWKFATGTKLSVPSSYKIRIPVTVEAAEKFKEDSITMYDTKRKASNLFLLFRGDVFGWTKGKSVGIGYHRITTCVDLQEVSFWRYDITSGNMIKVLDGLKIEDVFKPAGSSTVQKFDVEE